MEIFIIRISGIEGDTKKCDHPEYKHKDEEVEKEEPSEEHKVGHYPCTLVTWNQTIQTIYIEQTYKTAIIIEKNNHYIVLGFWVAVDEGFQLNKLSQEIR